MSKKIYKKEDRDTGFDFGKLPPQAVEFEEIILGNCLFSSEGLDAVLEIIPSEDVFYKEAHKIIFTTVKEMNISGEPVDLVTITQKLFKLGKLEYVGGAYYISSLLNRIGIVDTLEYTCRIVLQKYVARILIEKCSGVIGKCYSDAHDIFDTYDEFNQAFDLIDQVLNTGRSLDVKIETLANNAVDRYYERKRISESGLLIGCTTGLRRANAMTTGWRKKNLIVLAARPAMGKTAFLVNNAREAVKYGWIPIIFSLEMPSEQLIDRFIQSEAQDLNPDEFTFGRLDGVNEQVMKQAAETISKYSMFIDDTPNIKPSQLLARVRRIQREVKATFASKGIKEEPNFIVFVDYLQIMDSDSKNAIREQEVSSIVRGLKTCAKKLDLPVVALAQLSRQVESRGDKRPILADLRESGAIEQEADVIGFLFRYAYYGILVDENNNSLEGIGELIIAKNRHGKITTLQSPIQFRHNASITYIYDAYEDYLDLSGNEKKQTYDTNAGLAPSNDFLQSTSTPLYSNTINKHDDDDDVPF